MSGAPLIVPEHARAGTLVLGAPTVCCPTLPAQVIVAADAGSAGPEGDGPRVVVALAGSLFVGQRVSINAATPTAGASGSPFDAIAAEF